MEEQHGVTADHFVENFLREPFEKRWELLKPTILRLYLEEGERIEALVDRMKNEYSFTALEHQYKYRFKKWGIKKRTTAEEKKAIISVLGKRMRSGATLDDVTIREGGLEKKVDKKQMKRFIQDSRGRNLNEQDFLMAPGTFLAWNLPFNALVTARMRQYEHLSPFGSGPATPAFLTVNTPGSAPSPSSQQVETTPTTQLVHREVLSDRSKLFLSGRHTELLRQVGHTDRKLITSWLNDFWIHSFMTAKYWGRGPESWRPGLIAFKTLGPPDTMLSPTSLPSTAEQLSSPGDIPSRLGARIEPPTQLCRWSIHTIQKMYERVPSPEATPHGDVAYDMDDDSNWPRWPNMSNRPSLGDSMSATLESNAFTEISHQELPMSASSIVKTVQKSPEQLHVDAFAFAIMSGNEEKVMEAIRDNVERHHSCRTTNPFHLAASYMDGSKTCCTILSNLVEGLGQPCTILGNFTDSRGHTVLDMLVVNILRSHTDVPPELVSDRFRGDARFPAEERDICGRWDADSPCVRRLLIAGEPRIPLSWKHAFCHTAAQTICHSITSLFGNPGYSPDINTPSGLFTRVCHECGVQLSLRPLHTLALVAFYLAANGRPGETLFGAVACLLTLLAHNVDPCETADVSVSSLLNKSDCVRCDHRRLSPLELASAMASRDFNSWPEEVQLGWRVFVQALNRAVNDRATGTGARVVDLDEEHLTDDEPGSDEEETRCRCNYEEVAFRPLNMNNFYCNSPVLGRVWAAIQTELLTYRRISESDPWISANFDMKALPAWLEGTDTELRMPLVDNGMMREHTRCGWFHNARDPFCPSAVEVCSEYFMNMEDWRRTTFLAQLDRLDAWFDSY